MCQGGGQKPRRRLKPPYLCPRGPAETRSRNGGSDAPTLPAMIPVLCSCLHVLMMGFCPCRMQGIVHLTPLHTGQSPLTLRVHPFPIGSRWTSSPFVGSHPLDWLEALSSDLDTWGRCPGQALAWALRCILFGHRGWSPVSRIVPERLCVLGSQEVLAILGEGLSSCGDGGGDTLGAGSGDTPTQRIYTA